MEEEDSNVAQEEEKSQVIQSESQAIGSEMKDEGSSMAPATTVSKDEEETKGETDVHT